MKKKLNLIIMLIGILIFLIIIFTNVINYKNLQEDIFFLKFLSENNNNDNRKDEELNSVKGIIVRKENIQYIFDIEYKNTTFRNVNLLDTINSKTLVNEKIAPGVNGTFDIVIYSNHNANYNIYFESVSQKPQNLKFYIVGTDCYKKTLEELSDNLSGTIQKGDKKTITIGWKWEYENGEKGSMQDTEDAELIDKYLFNILALGEEII